MTKDVCLGGNRALDTGLKKFSLVLCVEVLENECIGAQANAGWKDLI